MSLDLFNNLLNNVKENKVVQNFMKELSDSLEKKNNELSNQSSLKQEDELYQVIELDEDGAYLQNIKDNKVSKETDISKDVLDNIGNDFVLRYKDGEYIYEEDLTKKFMDSLVDINEYQKIKEDFLNESNISEVDEGTKFTIKEKEEDYCILNYENGNTIKVPTALVPFWSDVGEDLYYKNEKFNRDI